MTNENYTLERQYKRNGYDFKLYHMPELKNPYVLLLRYSNKNEQDALAIFSNNFMTAHKQFEMYKKTIL